MRTSIGAIALLTVCFLGVAAAQVSATGKITGVVTDSSGAAVTNAEVTAKGSSLMATRTAHTASDGSYLFDLLPPGSYTMTISAGGFQTLGHTGIVITAGFTATGNTQPPLGQG